jgi:hypothetical protein
MRWEKLDRFSKLSSCLYPHLTPPERQREMQQIAAREKKRPPVGPATLSDEKRGSTSPLGGTAVGWDRLKK